MLILSGDSGLSNQTLIAALIGAAVTLILAYLAPFSERRNSEVSTLHSESVWREKLFTLASTPDDQMKAKNIELFRTFLSATRGIPDGSAVYDPDCRKAKGKDLDNLCLYFYSDLKKDLDQGQKTIAAEKSQVLRQLCRLLLKSDWNMRIHPSNFETTENEILYKAILLITFPQSKLENNKDQISTILHCKNTYYDFSLIHGELKLTKQQKVAKDDEASILPDEFGKLLEAVVENSPCKTYPWAITKVCLVFGIISSSVTTIHMNWDKIQDHNKDLWFVIPIVCLMVTLIIFVWQTHIIQNFCFKICPRTRQCQWLK